MRSVAIGVQEPARTRVEEAPTPIRLAEFGRLGSAYWGVVAVGAVLTLARFSEAFLILRAQGMGLPIALAPLVLVVMNIVYAASAYPIGILSDRIDRRTLLGAGFGVLILSDAVLAFAPNLWMVMLGIGLWGLHMGMTQGLLATLVTDTAPSAARGTAFGFFNVASGIALLLASLIAGVLWDVVGPPATFLAGAGFTAAGLVGTFAFVRGRTR
jgi:MFS family permease